MSMLRQFFFLLLALPGLAAEKIEKFSFHPPPDMQRADLYAVKVAQPRGVLVLCPGYNGNGESLVRQPAWQEFAHQHKLGLVGLSFASDVALLTHGRGYYYASQGSGNLLLAGVRQIYGKDLPLLLYGFSGGAHFTSRFVEWKPTRVIAWCAYSAGWWDMPQKAEKNPPGIVACGDRDERYGASLMYFKQGRALGKPWLWVSVPKTGHSVSPPVEEFVRDYFEKILIRHDNSGLWVDIDRKNRVEDAERSNQPSVTAWLPDAGLLAKWSKIHEP